MLVTTRSAAKRLQATTTTTPRPSRPTRRRKRATGSRVKSSKPPTAPKRRKPRPEQPTKPPEMTPMEVAQVLAPVESDQTRLIEWLDLPYQKTAGLVHDFDWTAALRDLHRQQGCDIISVGQTLDEEQPARLWIVVEWNTAAERAGQEQSNAFAALCNKVQRLMPDSNDKKNDFQIVRFKHLGPEKPPIIRGQDGSRPEVHEIFTAYFPADISAQNKAQITRMEGFLQIENNINNVWLERGDRKDSMGPMDELKWYSKGWIEGDVQHNGQTCIRLVYFILWMYPDSPKLCKETQWWFSKASHRDERKLTLALEVFLDDMEEWGMVGHESVVGRFEDLRFYSEDSTWENVKKGFAEQPKPPFGVKDIPFDQREAAYRPPPFPDDISDL